MVFSTLLEVRVSTLLQSQPTNLVGIFYSTKRRNNISRSLPGCKMCPVALIQFVIYVNSDVPNKIIGLIVEVGCIISINA